MRAHRERISSSVPATAFVLAVVISAFLWTDLQFSRVRQSGPVLVENAFARNGYRPIEPRITGVSQYRPFRARGGNGNKSLRDVTADTSKDLHTTGVLLLLDGDARGALTMLQTAAGGGSDLETTTDAAVLTDLAVAYYEHAMRESQPVELAYAASASSRAIELAPRAPSAWYVHALVFEALHLREDAMEAWQSYLSCDSASGWATEARQHLASLQQPAAKDERRKMRTDVEDRLLPEWSAAVLSSDPQRAPASLEKALQLGDALCRRGGDCTALDAATVARQGNPDDVARAYRAYGEARSAYSRVRDVKARDGMIQAGRLLDAVDSALSARAWILAATVTHYLGGNDEALADIDHALAVVKGREERYPLATGQALWTRGLIEFAQGRPHEAQLSYEAARAHLQRAGEESNIAGVEAVLAETCRYVGDPENAWTHHLLALRALSGDATYIRRQVTFSDIATAAMELHQYRFASIIVRRLLLRAEAARDPAFQALAWYTMARIDIARGRSVFARDELEHAAMLLDRIEPNGTTMRLIADVMLERGEMRIASDPRQAIEYLRDAGARLAKLNHRTRLPRLHLLAARAQAKLGDAATAELEMRAGLDELERQRRTITDDQDRSTFTDTGRSLYDELVRLLVARARETEALAVVRRARTLGLTDPAPMMTTAGLPPAAAAPVAQVAVIEYYVLPHQLLVWTTFGGRTQFENKQVERAKLDGTCTRTADCVASASVLYDLLVRAPLESVPPEVPLVIAPDGPVHRVPFSALYDNVTRRYLVEAHSLTIALGGNAIAPVERPYRSILVVAAPDPGGELQPLPAVMREAEGASRQFAQSQILQGSNATGDRLLESAGEFDLVHFAGHASANESQPRLAALRCAPASHRSDGSLYAWEIATRRFPKTRLVVLAACDTARGRLVSSGLLG